MQTTVKLFAGAYLFFIFLISVASFRNDYAGFFQIFLENLTTGTRTVFAKVFEFGNTAATLRDVYVQRSDHLINEDVFYYVKSLLVVIPGFNHFFPNMGYELAFPLHLGNWHGDLGGSYIAETYYVFGNFSVLIMPVIGYAVGWVGQKMDEAAFTDYRAFIMLLPLYGSILLWVRGVFYAIVRNVCWNILFFMVICALMRISGHQLKNRIGENHETADG